MTGEWFYDYEPPGLRPLPEGFESHFPNVHRRPSFSAHVPHVGRDDGRFQGMGWLTWEEATLVYNYGLTLQGRNFIEIGCNVGWSTVALALSGVALTVVDPVLDGMEQGESCRESLARAGVLHRVSLCPGRSPEAVAALARDGRRWCGVFVDADHTGDAPLLDTRQASEAANEDALILLHDMVQDNIGAALTWLRSEGWSCGVHYTAQFIGAAWRGDARPVSHAPDPRVAWDELIAEAAPHLREFPRI